MKWTIIKICIISNGITIRRSTVLKNTWLSTRNTQPEKSEQSKINAKTRGNDQAPPLCSRDQTQRLAGERTVRKKGFTIGKFRKEGEKGTTQQKGQGVRLSITGSFVIHYRVWVPTRSANRRLIKISIYFTSRTNKPSLPHVHCEFYPQVRVRLLSPVSNGVNLWEHVNSLFVSFFINRVRWLMIVTQITPSHSDSLVFIPFKLGVCDFSSLSH